jgi:hypothetical protein
MLEVFTAPARAQASASGISFARRDSDDMSTHANHHIEPDGRPDEDEELEKDVERPAEENEADPETGKGE